MKCSVIADVDDVYMFNDIDATLFSDVQALYRSAIGIVRREEIIEHAA